MIVTHFVTGATGLVGSAVGVQLRRLFDWLVARHGGTTWVERSGGSLRVVHRLIEHFPGARFVHLVRDGRATALSMSRHRGFRRRTLADHS